MEDFRCCGKRLQMADRGKESEMTKTMDLWYEGYVLLLITVSKLIKIYLNIEFIDPSMRHN